MRKKKLAVLFAVGLVLAPVPLLAQSAPPARPGDRGPVSNGVGGISPPPRPGERVGPSSGVGGTAAPAIPGGPPPPTTFGTANGTMKR